MSWFRGGSEEVLAGSVGPIEIRKPWARAASHDSSMAGGFLTLFNKETAPDRLVSASSPAADKIEIHAIQVVGADIDMRPLENGISLHGGLSVTLKPRGYHLLMTGLKAPLVVGDSVPVTLVLEKAGSVEIALKVEAPGPVGEKVLHEERGSH